MLTHKIHGKLLGFKLKIRLFKKTATLFFLYIIRTWLPSNTLKKKDFLTTSTQLQGNNIP